MYLQHLKNTWYTKLEPPPQEKSSPSIQYIYIHMYKERHKSMKSSPRWGLCHVDDPVSFLTNRMHIAPEVPVDGPWRRPPENRCDGGRQSCSFAISSHIKFHISLPGRILHFTLSFLWYNGHRQTGTWAMTSHLIFGGQGI